VEAILRGIAKDWYNVIVNITNWQPTMNNPPPKTDLQVLLEELRALLARAKAHPESLKLELEILKITSELVKLNQEGIYKEVEGVDRIETHKRELDYKYKTSKWHENSETFRNRINLQSKMISEAVGFAKIAINTLVIVSAGGVLAILAFLGNVLKAGCKLGEIDFILFFIGSTAFAILTACFGYFAQISFSEPHAPRMHKWGNFCRFIAIIFIGFSFSLFISGSVFAVRTFDQNKVVSCPPTNTIQTASEPKSKFIPRKKATASH
jgi:hypothetical protein